MESNNQNRIFTFLVFVGLSSEFVVNVICSFVSRYFFPVLRVALRHFSDVRRRQAFSDVRRLVSDAGRRFPMLAGIF